MGGKSGDEARITGKRPGTLSQMGYYIKSFAHVLNGPQACILQAPQPMNVHNIKSQTWLEMCLRELQNMQKSL